MDAKRDLKTVKITAPVVSIYLKEKVVSVAQLMIRKEIRRLVVTDGEKLVGMMMNKDLTRSITCAVEEFATTWYLMEKKR